MGVVVVVVLREPLGEVNRSTTKMKVHSFVEEHLKCKNKMKKVPLMARKRLHCLVKEVS